jgi:hypothetical protein
MELTEETIETFIIQHKDKFNVYDASMYHNNKFFHKLLNKFRKFVDISPYIIKLAIIWVTVAVLSLSTLFIWNSYLRKDRDEVTLKQKIGNIIFKK